MDPPAFLAALSTSEAIAARLKLQKYRCTLVRLNGPAPKCWLPEEVPQADAGDHHAPSLGPQIFSMSSKASKRRQQEQQQEDIQKKDKRSGRSASRAKIASHPKSRQPKNLEASESSQWLQQQQSVRQKTERSGHSQAACSSRKESTRGAITCVTAPLRTAPPTPQLCNICGELGDPSRLLLCDGPNGFGGTCDEGYHYDCLGLDAVPEGDWFCPKCQPMMSGQEERKREKRKMKMQNKADEQADEGPPLDMHERLRLQCLLDRFPEDVLDKVADAIEEWCGELEPGNEELKLDLDLVPSQKQRHMLTFVEEEWAKLKAERKLNKTKREAEASESEDSDVKKKKKKKRKDTEKETARESDELCF